MLKPMAFYRSERARFYEIPNLRWQLSLSIKENGCYLWQILFQPLGLFQCKAKQHVMAEWVIPAERSAGHHNPMTHKDT